MDNHKRQNVDIIVKIFYLSKFAIGIFWFSPSAPIKRKSVVTPYSRAIRTRSQNGGSRRPSSYFIYRWYKISNLAAVCLGSQPRVFRSARRRVPNPRRMSSALGGSFFAMLQSNMNRFERQLTSIEVLSKQQEPICRYTISEAETPVFNRCVIDFAPVDSTEFV